MPALQHFFDAERLRRGWSMRDAAKRSQISLSKAYAIVKGDDNVEFETFENIASAFDLTPAELAVIIGKGAPTADPDEVHLIALFRQVPEEKRSAARDMLRGLAVQPVNRGPANGRRDGAAKRRAGALHQSDQRGEHPPTDEGNDTLTVRSRRAGHVIGNALAFILGPFSFERPLTAAARQI